MKRIVVLGSTGSIGQSALSVIEHHHDRFRIVGLAAGRNAKLLERQCRRHPEAHFTLGSQESLTAILKANGSLAGRSRGCGGAAVLNLIEASRPDLVLNAFVGFAGLEPALYCLEKGINVALANKEAIVAGGRLLKIAARNSGAVIVPVDSEHVAVSQCLSGRPIEEVRRIFLTASGGALRDRPLEELETAGIEDVLRHPTWDMGDKITVDSATMMNKGMEVIEARWLFNLALERIELIIHPQSIVHSLVEFIDGSIIAQLGLPDMRLPILHALSHPGRLESDLIPSKIDEFPELSFRKVDIKRYPCLNLALAAARRGGAAPTVLLAANEVAVASFLAGRVPFSRIADIIGDALDNIPPQEPQLLKDIFEVAENTKRYIERKFCLQHTNYTWSTTC